MNWRVLLFALNGDGTESFIKGDIPLSGSVPTRKLSSPHQITGALTRSVTDLVNPDGSPVIKRWKTTVYVADDNDKIWVGGIVADFTIEGPNLTLDVAGFTAYLKGQPFDSEYTGVGVDPFEVVRLFWAHAQGRPGGNLGLEIDATTSPIRIGEPPRQVEFNADGSPVSFQADDRSIKHNWWSTADMGGVIDQLARDTPFDYIEEHTWNGEQVRHSLRLGYPTLGAQKPELRFVLAENVKVLPREGYSGDDVVTEVWVYGAGEGRDRVRGVASIHPRDSLRRVKQVDDKKIESNEDATNRARDILMSYQPDIPGAGVTDLLVTDHSNAEFGTFDVGDEIIYSGEHQWGDVVIWIRILSMTLLSSGQMQLTVVRADTLKS